MKDLIVLVADKNMEFLIKGLFPRIPRVEGLRNFSFDSFVHPFRDPGIVHEADKFLRPFSDKYAYSLVILDYEGSGQEDKSREIIETEISEKLNRVGWQDRTCVICIHPELENWIWVSDVRIQAAIDWDNKMGIYDWLYQNELKSIENTKPDRPKEAFEEALRICNTPRSSSLYENIGSRASYRRCQDQAFWKMINCLKEWFALEDN